ncbi:hypothetical protein [Amycolatopsis sp. Hca4]|uniref:hypothetical protein n=1 Tax=Amycolatopsis sp. Hca4 TaxID=2742131 RepID=UPI0015906DDA|nr:hypothetical protein [Amycolatopsis sp. Hca4]QKV75305.1 hypothetical protein HUT10_17145 [Amycolatopsis sp. Hca4]
MSQDALAALSAPRSSGKAELVVWQEDGTFNAATDFENGIASLYGGRLALSRYVDLDGRQAAVVDVDAPGGRRISRLVAAAPRGLLLHAEFDVPRSAAGGYLPHWDTVLASWQWL